MSMGEIETLHGNIPDNEIKREIYYRIRSKGMMEKCNLLKANEEGGTELVPIIII